MSKQNDQISVMEMFHILQSHEPPLLMQYERVRDNCGSYIEVILKKQDDKKANCNEISATLDAGCKD